MKIFWKTIAIRYKIQYVCKLVRCKSEVWKTALLMTSNFRCKALYKIWLLYIHVNVWKKKKTGGITNLHRLVPPHDRPYGRRGPSAICVEVSNWSSSSTVRQTLPSLFAILQPYEPLDGWLAIWIQNQHVLDQYLDTLRVHCFIMEHNNSTEIGMQSTISSYSLIENQAKQNLHSLKTEKFRST